MAIRKQIVKGIQLSLFDSDWRDRSDRELIAELTTKPAEVAEVWEYSYSMERLFNHLTPQRRRIAVAAIELYRRREGRREKSQSIKCSNDIFQAMQPVVGDLEVEEFWVLPLSQSMRLIQPIRISIGGIASTMADVRIVFRKLVEVGATAFAVVHNHPSGHILPSVDDDRLTQNLTKAAEVMKLRFLDHVIIGGNFYYSYMDEGKM